MKHLSISLIVTGLIQLLNIVGGVITARYLHPEGRGLLAAAMLWPSLLAGIGLISVDQGVLYYTTRRRDSASEFLTSGMFLAAGLAALTCGIGYVLMPYILSSTNPELVSDARLYLLFVPCNFLSLTIISSLNGRLQFGAVNVLRLTLPILSVVAAIFCIAINATTVKAFLTASLLGPFGIVAAAVLFCRRGFGPLKLEDAWAELSFGAKLHFSALIAIAAGRIDQTIISLDLPADRLGFYVVALSVAGTATLAANTLPMLAFPKIADKSASARKMEIVRRYFQLALIFTILSSGAVYGLASWLLPTLYGLSFSPAVGLVTILLLAAPALAMSAILMVTFRAHGKAGTVAQVTLVNFVVATAALKLLVTQYGLTGATWAYTVAQWATALFALLRLRETTGITPQDLFRLHSDDLSHIYDTLAPWRDRLRRQRQL